MCFLSFLQGLGKKKVESSHKSKFIPDFIAWVPHKKEISQSGPLESVYKDTFRDSERTTAPQILVNTIPKPRAVKEGSFTPSKSVPYSDPIDIEDTAKPVTTYEFVHSHMQPNRSIHTNMNTGKVEATPVPAQITPNYINPKVPSIYDRPKTTLTRLRRARISSAPNLRSSVADCLRWHDADDNKDSRPKTASGCLPELSSNGNTQVLSLAGSAPNLSSQSMNFQNGSHSNPMTTSQPAWTSNDYIKTSRVPATQTVQSMGNSSNGHVDVSPPAQMPMEEG